MSEVQTVNGLVLVDKPAGCTSHDVVHRWRKLAQTKRVGHLGTLDPMATGLLALVTGSATRLAQFFRLDEKTYQARLVLGKTSDTYDADGVMVEVPGPLPSARDTQDALLQFKGTQAQVPPPVSAKKVNGVRAYTLARRNEPVVLAPVTITIRSIDVTFCQPPEVAFTLQCSSGTYIRSIAHDLGRMLGCGAILTRLRRTHIGDFSVTDARTMEQLTELAAEHRLGEAVLPARALLPEIPTEYVDSITEAHIRQGRNFRTSPFVVAPGSPYVKALSQSGELVAIGELCLPNLYHPTTVF